MRARVTAAAAACLLAAACTGGALVLGLGALVITLMAIPFAVWLNRLQRRTSLEGSGA